MQGQIANTLHPLYCHFLYYGAHSQKVNAEEFNFELQEMKTKCKDGDEFDLFHVL